MVKMAWRWLVVGLILLGISVNVLTGRLNVVVVGVWATFVAVLYVTPIAAKISSQLPVEWQSRWRAAFLAASVAIVLLVSQIGSQRSVEGWLGYWSMAIGFAALIYRTFVDDQSSQFPFLQNPIIHSCQAKAYPPEPKD